MVRTRTSVVSAETVAPVTTLRRRTHGLFAGFGMRGRVNPFSVFVDVGAMFDKLRIVWCRRRWRRVGEDSKWCDQSHRENDLQENFHADSPCLFRYCASPNSACVWRAVKLRGME